MAGQIIADPSKLYELDDNLKKTPSQIDDIIADYSEMISHTRDRVSNTLNQWKRRQQQAYEQLLDAQEALDRAEMLARDSEDGHVSSYYYEVVESCQNRYNEISNACNSIEKIYDQVESSATLFTRTMGNLRQDYTTLLQKSSYILTRYADLVKKSSSITSIGSSSSTGQIKQDNSHSSNQTSLSLAQALASYMYKHNYGKEDYAIYSQDPEWRVLQKAANPDCKIPPLDQYTAKRLLSQYMFAHNFSKEDYDVYSKDPIWQELITYAFPEYADSFTRAAIQNFSSNYSLIVSSLNSAQIKHNPIVLSKQPRTATEIINSLGGGDKTEGSCSSLAFAYVGNVAGYNVLDFRDGDSREFFSSNKSIKLISELPGVKSKIIYGKDEVRCTVELMNSMISGREYYLATGQHASIVRKIDDHFEYLELQSAWDNGWHSLNTSILTNRFGCDTNNQHEYPNFLIDVQSLSQNKEFLDVLVY